MGGVDLIGNGISCICIQGSCFFRSIDSAAHPNSKDRSESNKGNARSFCTGVYHPDLLVTQRVRAPDCTHACSLFKVLRFDIQLLDFMNWHTFPAIARPAYTASMNQSTIVVKEKAWTGNPVGESF